MHILHQANHAFQPIRESIHKSASEFQAKDLSHWGVNQEENGNNRKMPFQ
jgi:hypothetical protein